MAARNDRRPPIRTRGRALIVIAHVERPVRACKSARQLHPLAASGIYRHGGRPGHRGLIGHSLGYPCVSRKHVRPRLSHPFNSRYAPPATYIRIGPMLSLVAYIRLDPGYVTRPLLLFSPGPAHQHPPFFFSLPFSRSRPFRLSHRERSCRCCRCSSSVAPSVTRATPRDAATSNRPLARN